MAYLCTPQALRLQIRQIRRWLRAAQQDLDPGVRFLHASYAVANLDMLRQLASDADTLAATGEDPARLHAAAAAIQDEAQGALEIQHDREARWLGYTSSPLRRTEP